MTFSPLAVFIAAAGLTFATSTYTVAVIPAPSGFTIANMAGINDSGQAAGTGAAGVATQAFIGSPSGSTPIPLPSGWSNSYGAGVNAFGRVVGYGADQAFIGTVAGSTAIPFPPGWTYALGLAVNNSGQVAGSSDTPQAFIGTVLASAAIPFPAGFSGAFGYAVNVSGQVTGYAVNGTSSQAYVGTISGSTAIPLLPGWTFMQGSAINDLGQIAGFGNIGANMQAFIGTTSGSTAIPLPIGATSAYAEAQSINNLGTVVGSSSNGTSAFGGWIWNATDGTVLLNDLVPLGWNVLTALSISNNGLILAQASYMGGAFQFVELTPTSCNFSLTPPNTSLGATAGSGSLTVTTASGCAWQAVSNDNWLTITAGTSGTGSGTVNFNASANADFSPRVGTLLVGGQTFTVTQAATPPAPPTLVFPANGATVVSVMPTLTWNASSGATSYSIYFGTETAPPMVNSTTGTSFSPGTMVAGQTYYWQIVAMNSGGTGASPVWSFTTSNPCALTVSPNAVLIGYGGGPGSVSVSAGTGCAWTATSGAAWLTITGGASGTGNGTISFTVGANAGAAQLAYIGVAGQRVVAMQGGSPSVQPFNDVPTTDPYFDYISVMENYGITLGCQASPPLYCPSSPVTRAEMAAFLIRAYDVVLNVPLTYPPTAYFQDLPASGIPDSQFFPDVQRLAQLGITLGCQASPPLFCPDGPVSQGEMAAFLIRAWMLLNNVTTLTYPTTPYFTDVPATDQFFSYIQKMAQLGFWTGCGGGQYCESSTVTRDQMAPMILRSMLGAP